MKTIRNYAAVCLAACLFTGMTGCNDGASPPEGGSGTIPTGEVKQPNETGFVLPEEKPLTGFEVTLESADVAGYEGALKRYAGKVIFVDFWATWCGNCRQAFPHSVSWSKEFPAKDFAVISVSVDEPSEDVKKQALTFLKKQQAVFTNLISSYEDPDEAFELFGIEGGALPHYKLYGRDGKLIRTFGIDSKEKWGPKDVAAAIKAAIDKQ